MEHGLPQAAGPTPTGPVAPDLDDPRAPQLLATEHWSLLATRSLSWTEAFSRTSMFLSTLSAATVALALAGPAMAFGSAFSLFALIVLLVTMFLGAATFVRLTQVNNEDLFWVAGMNLLRAGYIEMVPGVEGRFVTGHTLDVRGISRSFGAIDVLRPSVLHFLVTTPAVVGVISSAIGGVIGGLVAVVLGADLAPAIAVGFVVFVASVAVFIGYAWREGDRYRERLAALTAISAGQGAAAPTPRPEDHGRGGSQP
jgi:hypothetical protein